MPVLLLDSLPRTLGQFVELHSLFDDCSHLRTLVLQHVDVWLVEVFEEPDASTG